MSPTHLIRQFGSLVVVLEFIFVLFVKRIRVSSMYQNKKMPCPCNQVTSIDVRGDHELDHEDNCINRETYRTLLKNINRETDPTKRTEMKRLNSAITDSTKNWALKQAVAGFGAQAKYDIRENKYCFSSRPKTGLSLYCCEKELEKTQPFSGFLRPADGSRADPDVCGDLTYTDCERTPCADLFRQ